MPPAVVKPEEPRMWHVTLTVAGDPMPAEKVCAALERLAEDHPFLLTARYSDRRAEVRYWEQAPDVQDAAAMALRLWGEHRKTADLPPWETVGIEIVDRDTWHFRRLEAEEGRAPRRVAPTGHIRPF